MHRFLAACLTGICLFLATCGATGAQDKAAEPPKPGDTKKVERDGSSVALSYTLAGIAVIVVIALVCMPARRE